jgi:hypothetical protein
MAPKKEWTLDELLKLPKSRGEALALNLSYYFNNNLCKKKHIAPRHYSGKCAECLRIRGEKHRRRCSANRRGLSEWVDGRVSKSVDLAALIESGLPSSRSEAKRVSSKYYYTGEPCKNNHFSPCYVDHGCVQCNREDEHKYKERKSLWLRNKTERKRIEADITPKPRAGPESATYKHGKARSFEQMLYNAAKQRSRNKGVEFNISVQDINIPTHCPILGIKLSTTWGGVDMNNQARAAQPSLDRIDPRKGYIPGNVIVISYRANNIKGDGLPKEHRAIAKYIEVMEKIKV